MVKKFARISKLAPVTDPEYPTPSMEDYETGKLNGNVSIPVDYWIEGYLTDEPEVGKPVVVDRVNRCGVKMPGIFTSSIVTEITDTGFKTLNSVYNLEYIKL